MHYNRVVNDITRKAIADALKRLLMEKPLSRVTVMDIAAECVMAGSFKKAAERFSSLQ